MQVEIRDDMKLAFAEQVTKENIQDIANAIQEYSNCELEIKVYDNEIDIDNKTFFMVDCIMEGDWVVINKSEIGYFIYRSKEEMETMWNPLTKTEETDKIKA